MGRITKEGDELASSLFEDLPEQTPPNPLEMGTESPPIWSKKKAELVSTYLKLYQQITYGGFYIDGFCAPQRRDHENELWTAKKVLEIEPKRIRRFYLVDMDQKERGRLRQMKSRHHVPGQRYVHTYTGDFNRVVDDILDARRIISGNSACFAFLDQRGTECDWRTLEKLAEHRPKRKIELLYLFSTGWTHRTIDAIKNDQSKDRLDRWWGRPTWREDLCDITQVQQAELMQRRFEQELGYRYVMPVPILHRGHQGRRLYYLLHASDHEQANKLMKRAYKRVVGRTIETTTDQQISMDQIFGINS